MGKFNRDNNRKPSSGSFSRGFDHNKSFGGNRRSGGRNSARPAMHQATCSECGQACEIPFRPSGDRPIFCSECFEKKNGGSFKSRPSNFGNDRRDRFSFEDKQMHRAVCAKCGQDCQVPFLPTAGKPVFCDNCFGKGGNNTKDSGEVRQQIKMLNTKLDQLIKILTPSVVAKKTTKLKIESKAVAKVAVKAKVKVPKKKTAKKK